jgi:hypothetical protein
MRVGDDCVRLRVRFLKIGHPAQLACLAAGVEAAERSHRIDAATAPCRAAAISEFNAAMAKIARLDCDDKSKRGTPVECVLGPPKDPEDVLACHSARLAVEDAGTLKQVQAQILAAEAKGSASDWPSQAALVVALLSAVPWLCYFLLRRVAELRSAIAGKPPDSW